MRGFLSDVRHFVSNAGAQQAFVADYSRNSNSAAIAGVQHLIAASPLVRIFFEVVDSKASVTDSLSRDARSAWKGWDVSDGNSHPWPAAKPAPAEAA